jgi:hypothetical protein
MIASVSIGDQVFRGEGDAFGAVRAVRAHALVVFVEGHGDVVLPAAAVRAVHDGKVVVDAAALPEALRTWVARAHALEDPDL